ncbi:ribonuclease H-like domain-containing protein [Xylaria sp. FL1042]|nr:ribonuclease H-like domain-containing protein [Xylaria sp. FL1042]
MSAVPEYKPIIAYDSRGRAVCYDHHLRLCHVCCVHYEGPGYGPMDEDDDQVPILEPGSNLFIPQWDSQVLGPTVTYNHGRDYNNPPKALTPDQLKLHYCRECQLTWLEGDEGVEAVQSHPSHHAYHHIWAGTSRSLVVFTDGACPSNGTSNALNASIGVHFGYQSEYNISQRLDSDSTPTNQAAEIAAAVAALQQVRQTVEPARRALIQASLIHISEDHRRDIRQFRLIVATDSSYLVQCISKHIKKWTMVDGIYRNEQGRPVKNSNGFAKLNREVERLSMVGVEVAWYHVPREFNKEADALARSALRPSEVFSGFAVIA